MLLAIDIGNTNVVIGLLDKGELIQSWRLDSQTRRTEDEWHLLLRTLFSQEDKNLSLISGIAISSVVPSLTPFFKTLSRKYLNLEPLVISANIDLGFELKVEDPLSVGADRICNIAAAFSEYGGPLIVVDFGTATTFDVADAKGNYLGGIISPGLETAARHLHKLAAKLPSVELFFPDKIIATTTEGHMQVGIMYGKVASVNGLLDMIKKELNEDCKVIATGGFGRYIVSKLEALTAYDPDLTLKGMELIYNRMNTIKDN